MNWIRYVGLDRFALCKCDDNARRDDEKDPNTTQRIWGDVPEEPAEITNRQQIGIFKDCSITGLGQLIGPCHKGQRHSCAQCNDEEIKPLLRINGLPSAEQKRGHYDHMIRGREYCEHRRDHCATDPNGDQKAE